jgi:hypothetical protein
VKSVPLADVSRCSIVKQELLDHLVGLGEQGGWNLDPECSCCLQVDEEFKLARSRDRQVGRFLTLEDAACVDAELIRHVRNARSVAHQPARNGILAVGIDHGQCMPRGQHQDLCAAAVQKTSRG